jgi:hypothetical protein
MSKFAEHFGFTDRQIFKHRKGPAWDGNPPAPCQWKLCITATDEDYLVELLFKLSNRADCYYVKYSPNGSPKCRDGMFLGRVFLTTEAEIGKLWKELRRDSKLMCSVQDDGAMTKYR